MSIGLLVYSLSFVQYSENMGIQEGIHVFGWQKSKISTSLNSAIACIVGGIAQALYKEIPSEIILKARKMLPEEFLTIIDEFNLKFVPFAG